MAYTTDILKGNKVIALSATKGRFFYGTSYEFFEEIDAKKDEDLGTLEGGETVEKTYMVLVKTKSGTVYFPASDVQVQDDFGTKLEFDNSTTKWNQIIVAPDEKSEQKEVEPNSNLPTNGSTGGVWGGISDVIKSAGDLINGRKTNNANGTNPTSKSNNTTVIVLGLVGLIAVVVGIWLVSRKAKKSDLALATPQADVPSPVLSGLKLKY